MRTAVKNAGYIKSVSQAKLPYFETLNSRAARAALSSNVHQFCKPKSSCFLRETAVKQISLLGILDAV